MRSLIACLCFSAVTLFAAEQSSKEYNLLTLTPDEIDHAAIGHPRYDFRIDSKDGLVDSTGRTVAAHELAAYLKTRSLEPDAFYFLWITPTSATMDTLAPTLRALGDHGITKIVVRHEPRIVSMGKSTQPAKDLEKSIAALRTEKRSN